MEFELQWQYLIYKMRIIKIYVMYIIIYRAKTCTQTWNNTSDYVIYNNIITVRYSSRAINYITIYIVRYVEIHKSGMEMNVWQYFSSRGLFFFLRVLRIFLYTLLYPLVVSIYKMTYIYIKYIRNTRTRTTCDSSFRLTLLGLTTSRNCRGSRTISLRPPDKSSRRPIKN